ncbi:MAG TPA: VOC family protein [Chryseosolibacter sp.]
MHRRVTFVTLLVNDFDEAVAFYVEKLGFIKTADNQFGPDMRWVSVSPQQGSETEIVFVKADTPEKKRLVGSQVAGHVLMVLGTSNCDDDFRKLTNRGVKFHGIPKDVPWGREVLFEDLYGNLFDLVERRGN